MTQKEWKELIRITKNNNTYQLLRLSIVTWMKKENFLNLNMGINKFRQRFSKSNVNDWYMNYFTLIVKH